MWLIHSTHSASLRAGSAQDRFLLVFGGFLSFLSKIARFLLAIEGKKISIPIVKSKSSLIIKKMAGSFSNCRPFGQKRRCVDFPDYFSLSKLPYWAKAAISSAVRAWL